MYQYELYKTRADHCLYNLNTMYTYHMDVATTPCGRYKNIVVTCGFI